MTPAPPTIEQTGGKPLLAATLAAEPLRGPHAALPLMAQSTRARLRDRMSAFGSAAEEIAHSMAVDRVANDPERTRHTSRSPRAAAPPDQKADLRQVEGGYSAAAACLRDGFFRPPARCRPGIRADRPADNRAPRKSWRAYRIVRLSLCRI